MITVPAEPLPKDLPPLQELHNKTIVIVMTIHSHIGINLKPFILYVFAAALAFPK